MATNEVRWLGEQQMLSVRTTHVPSLAKIESQWATCQACDLHKTRRSVVQVRGFIPCQVLFIGEAPGSSEDSLGYPFVGEAGHAFDQLVADAFSEVPTPKPWRWAVVNVLACFPRDDKGKPRPPTSEEAKRCRPRLEALMKLTNPKLVVTMGKPAHTFTPIGCVDAPCVNVVHPSFIIRTQTDEPMKAESLAKRFVTTLTGSLRKVME